MRWVILSCVFLMACAAGSVPIWLKPGTGLAQAQQDQALCRAQASAQFPERSEVDTAPRITIGGRVCDGNVCIGAGALPDVFNVDANTGARDQAFGACMGVRGYQLTPLPRCRGKVQVLSSHPFDVTGVCSVNGTPAVAR